MGMANSNDKTCACSQQNLNLNRLEEDHHPRRDHYSQGPQKLGLPGVREEEQRESLNTKQPNLPGKPF